MHLPQMTDEERLFAAELARQNDQHPDRDITSIDVGNAIERDSWATATTLAALIGKHLVSETPGKNPHSTSPYTLGGLHVTGLGHAALDA